MNSSATDIAARLKAHLPELERYRVRSLALFGSVARGQAREDSDLDLLVEFDGRPDLFQFLDLEEFLTNLLGRKVDLVPRNSVKPLLRERIYGEAVRVV